MPREHTVRVGRVYAIHAESGLLDEEHVSLMSSTNFQFILNSVSQQCRFDNIFFLFSPFSISNADANVLKAWNVSNQTMICRSAHTSTVVDIQKTVTQIHRDRKSITSEAIIR